MTVWQIACGDGKTDLKDLFLKLKVALIGPGNLGDFFDHRADYLSLNDGFLVKRFCEEVSIDDVLVLKQVVNPHTHEWEILAVGTVISPYRYEPIFTGIDIDKWEMQHCRRVSWIVPESRVTVFGGGAPVRILKMESDNPLAIRALEIMGNTRS